MSQTWVIKDTAPIEIQSFPITEISFQSNNQNFSEINGGMKISGSGTQYTLNYDSTQVGITSSGTSPYTWTDNAYKTIIFKTAPTGGLLNWLQINASLQDDVIYGIQYQDIHLEDKSLWNEFQSAWAEDNYATALNKLQDSSIADKQLNAAVINDTTTELLRLQSQKDNNFKVGKIQIDDGTGSIRDRSVWFKLLGEATDFDDDSYYIQPNYRQNLFDTQINLKTKAADTMIKPSMAQQLFNRQEISLDESMQLIGNAIISLRRLTVVVKDPSGNAVEGAIVKGLAGNPVTNSSGIAAGLLSEYALTVIPPYVDLQTKTVDVSNVTDISINVTLEKYAENTILRFTESTSVQFSSQVKNIDICCVGAGGGGSGGYGHTSGQSGSSSWSAFVWKGKGGGGGNIVNSTSVSVTAKTAYLLIIGDGGFGSTPLTYDADSYLEQRANTAGTGGTTSFMSVSATGGTGGSTTIGTSTNGGNGAANATGTEFNDGSTYYSGGGANGGDPVTSGGKIISGPVGGTPYGGYGGYTNSSSSYGVAGGNGLGAGGGGGGGNADLTNYGNAINYPIRMTNGGNGASGLVVIKLHYN